MSRIDEIMEKYLVEFSDGNYMKVVKVIDSITTDYHVKGAINMVNNWYKTYGKGVTQEVMRDNLLSMIDDKVKSLGLKTPKFNAY